MVRVRGKWLWLPALIASGVVMMCALYGAIAWPAGEVGHDHKFFAQTKRPLAIAHRGGAGLWPENTMYAFERAAALGVDVLEIDVRSTADGVLVVLHDAAVERTTSGRGRVNELSLARLEELDAGYRWSPDGGRSFPLRGQDITVPTLREVFDAFPDLRFNIEPKQAQPSLAAPLCQMIRDAHVAERAMVGSFNDSVLEEFRRECPEVATSASTAEVSKLLAMSKVGLDISYSPVMQALQVPEMAGGLRVLSKRFVDAAHARNLEVHAWTVNEVEDMRRLLDMGVDGIMTDYPDQLLSLLGR